MGKKNISGYKSRAADNPTIALSVNGHKAVHRAGNDYLKETMGSVRSQAKNLSPRQMQKWRRGGSMLRMFRWRLDRISTIVLIDILTENKYEFVTRENKKFKELYCPPPSGLPEISGEYSLPEDLKEFYRECGGIKFFVGTDYAMEIVSPDNLVSSNPVILPEGWEEYIPENDISNDWYIIAEAGPEQRISIDLGENRIGKCYDSFWDIHASPGECPVLALSFSELLENIFNCKGGYWFWLADDFSNLDDAYD